MNKRIEILILVLSLISLSESRVLQEIIQVVSDNNNNVKENKTSFIEWKEGEYPPSNFSNVSIPKG